MLIKKLIFVGFTALSVLYPLANAVAASYRNDYKQMVSQLKKYYSIVIAEGKFRNDIINGLYNDAHPIPSTLCQISGHDGSNNAYVLIDWIRSNWGYTPCIVKIT